MSSLIRSIFTTLWGRLAVVHDERFIFNALFTKDTGTVVNNELTSLITSQLASYSDDPDFPFTLPLKPQGSTHQLKVCQALLQIPVGHTLTYGELALKIQSAPRAIGQACRRNPIALFIPCHRVVGKNGLGGFMGGTGDSLAYKSALLQHEMK